MNSQPAAAPFTCPMSYAQQRLWLLHQLDDDSPAYHVVSGLRLRGALDREYLQRALEAIAQRHEILRTTFGSDQDQPVQRVHSRMDLTIRVVVVPGVTSAEKERWIQDWTREEAQTTFDLAAGPLCRLTLFPLGADHHVLLAVVHHIVFDGWSAGVMVAELNEIYSALCESRPSNLPILPLQYADFALWQREWLQGERRENLMGYWKKQLAGRPDELNLPRDRTRPPRQTFAGSTVAFRLGSPVSKQLLEFGQSAQATPFITLLAAYGLLLARYSQQNEVLVGSPIANRTRTELEPLLGCFVNTLVLRIDLSGNPTFAELLQRVKHVALEGFAHQDMPFEQLMEELDSAREMSLTPLVQTFFVMQNAPVGQLHWPNLEITEFPIDGFTAKTDLTLALAPSSDGFFARFEYNTDLFDRAIVERMAAHFQVVLSELGRDPHQRVGQVRLLSVEEEGLILEKGRCPGRHPRDLTVHQLFEEQVARKPAAIAIRFGGQGVTYRELNARANALAGQLRRIGVGPDHPVAICLERSIELYAGLIAILKAGGAYLALDPSHPVERLSWLLEDSGARILITDEHALGGLSPPSGLLVIRLPSGWAESADSYPPSGASARHLAYISHTSGSTGVPKGVAIEHLSIVRLVKNPNFATFAAEDVFFQFAPVAFDASTLEIWGALLNGGTLVVPPPGMPTLRELGALLRRERVTTLWLSAGLFHLMVDEELTQLQTVRQVFAGGDVLSPHHVRAYLKALPAGHRLINGYGPTECTTFACCHSMSASSVIGERVPIGRPISGTDVYVLDDRLELVPFGVVGELFLGGDGLARAYWNQPGLTEERFVRKLFSDGATHRLYRTGDRARMRENGIIEFLGRTDGQVKLRGFRVEVGEVASVIEAHPNVKDCAVAVRGEKAESKKLFAYVVWHQFDADGEAGLLRTLRARLPQFMVPARVVTLAALPLSPNGKVDRDALPDPPPLLAQESATAGRTAIEEKMMSIWNEVLGTEIGSVDENFFQLGGHSLLATQIVSRFPEAFGVELPVRVVFEHPTVRELSKVLGHPFSDRSDESELGRILAEVEGLSEDEVLRQLNGGHEFPSDV